MTPGTSNAGAKPWPCDATKLQAPAVGLAVLMRGPLGSQDHRSAGSRKGKGRVGPAQATPHRGLSRSPWARLLCPVSER